MDCLPYCFVTIKKIYFDIFRKIFLPSQVIINMFVFKNYKKEAHLQQDAVSDGRSFALYRLSATDFKLYTNYFSRFFLTTSSASYVQLNVLFTRSLIVALNENIFKRMQFCSQLILGFNCHLAHCHKNYLIRHFVSDILLLLGISLIHTEVSTAMHYRWVV